VFESKGLGWRMVVASGDCNGVNIMGHTETVKMAHIVRLKYVHAILNVDTDVLRVGNASSTIQQVRTQ